VTAHWRAFFDGPTTVGRGGALVGAGLALGLSLRRRRPTAGELPLRPRQMTRQTSIH